MSMRISISNIAWEKDEEPEIAAKYGISSIPTLKVFVNGEVVRSSVGVQPKAAIESMLP